MTASKPFLSRPEQILYGRLVRAFPGHVILAQVAVARLLAADPAAVAEQGRPPAARAKLWIADFVICRPDFSAVAVVEIDDRTSKPVPRDGQRAKHLFLQSVGVKVVRVAADDLPHEAALKTLGAALPLHASGSQLMRRAS
jgi:hypothetical protein